MTRREQCRRSLWTAGLAVMAATALSSGVFATITSVSGQMTLIAPPPSVEFHELESDTTQFAFNERQCVRLGSDLKVNISTPGTFDDSTDLTPARIPAGTLVSSHFVHADKVGERNPRVELEGTLTTDAEILGIAITRSVLDASDFLGAIGTVYPTGIFGRAMNLDRQNEFLILHPDLRTVTVHTDNRDHSDNVRVITRCGLPPPPPPGGEGCTPGYWKQPHHFDSWQGYLPTDKFNAVFGVGGPFSADLTLVQALGLNGGGANALARHAVAALLDSAHASVDYELATADVIAMVKAARDSGIATEIEAAKNKLAALNQRGCPLN